METHFHHVIIPNKGVAHYQEVISWLNENVGKESSEWKKWLTELSSWFMFRDEKHALLFKLTWGGS